MASFRKMNNPLGQKLENLIYLSFKRAAKKINYKHNHQLTQPKKKNMNSTFETQRLAEEENEILK